MPRPYTYLLINDTNWYIGVRCANKVPAEQDTAYMSSSKYVKARIKSGEVFTKHILGEYETNEEACEAEDLYLRAHWDVPGRINKALGFKYEFDDEVRAKISAACKAAQARPEVKAKLSAASKAAFASPEVRAKMSASLKAAHARPEVRAKMSAAMKGKNDKPCTIDGITIYPSLKELVAELGKGKNGSNHPNFRYVQKT